MTESTQMPSSGNQTSFGNQVPWGKSFNENNQEDSDPSRSDQLESSFDENIIKGTLEDTQTTTSSNNPWKDFYPQPNQETTFHTEEPAQNQTPSWMEHLNTSIFQEATAPSDESSEENSHTVPTTDPHAGHVHAQTTQKSNPLTICALLGVVVLFGIVAWFILKKRKRH